MDKEKYRIMESNRSKVKRLERDVSSLEKMILGFSFVSSCDSNSYKSTLALTAEEGASIKHWLIEEKKEEIEKLNKEFEEM